MKLKKSRYNVIVERFNNDDLLIFNTFTSAFGILNNAEVKSLYFNDFIDDDLINDEETKKSVKIMLENGFLVKSDVDEVRKLELIEKINRYGSSNSVFLTIAPTLQCNMRCPYCYEEKRNSSMTEETKHNLVNFIKNYLNFNKTVKHFGVTWYGGEPLLETETIEYLSQEFIDICNEKGIEYSASIVTNGVLLERKVAELLKRCKVSEAQITIDGIGDVNNRTRKLKNGQDSFDIIINNINEIKDLIHISIRTNISKLNVNNAAELIEYIDSKKDWKKKVSMYFSPVTSTETVNSCVINDCYSIEEFGEIFRTLYQELLKRKLCLPYYPMNRSLSCGGLSITNMVIDPEGFLYKCWHRMGKVENSVGNVKDGISVNNEYINWLLIDTPDECKECIRLPICRSGCPDDRLKNGNRAECDYRSKEFINDLKEYYKFLNEIKITQSTNSL